MRKRSTPQKNASDWGSRRPTRRRTAGVGYFPIQRRQRQGMHASGGDVTRRCSVSSLPRLSYDTHKAYRQIPLAGDDAAPVPVHPDRRAAVVSHGPHDVLHLVQLPLRREEGQVRVVAERFEINRRPRACTAGGKSPRVCTTDAQSSSFVCD